MKLELYWDREEKCTKFKLLEDVTVANYVIPAGFISDGASVPRRPVELL